VKTPNINNVKDNIGLEECPAQKWGLEVRGVRQRPNPSASSVAPDPNMVQGVAFLK